VPLSEITSYLEHVRSSEIPLYEAAVGLMSVSLLQRQFVAYVELMTISLWQSGGALKRFVEEQLLTDRALGDSGVIRLEARTFEVVLSREGKLQGGVQGPESAE
jgi:hypothetical protein